MGTIKYDLDAILIKMKKSYIKFHNDLISKDTFHVGPQWKAHTRSVDLGNSFHIHYKLPSYGLTK